MEGWGHVTTAREVIRGEDSPVERCSTRAEGIREEIKDQRLVGSDQPLYSEEQSRSKDNVLQRGERRHKKGKRS